MRYLFLILICAMEMGACQAVPNARRLALGSREGEQVADNLRRWPKADAVKGVRKTFFATVRLAGIEAQAPGVLEYYGPRDFRIIAARPNGPVLFDARVNWAGVKVLRIRPGLPAAAVEMFTRDVVHAFEQPASLEELRAGEEKMVLERRKGDGSRYHWIFDRAAGGLQQVDVDLGLLDTLHIYYPGGFAMEGGEGWPREVQFVRRARFYEVSLRFDETAPVR